MDIKLAIFDIKQYYVSEMPQNRRYSIWIILCTKYCYFLSHFLFIRVYSMILSLWLW